MKKEELHNIIQQIAEKVRVSLLDELISVAAIYSIEEAGAIAACVVHLLGQMIESGNANLGFAVEFVDGEGGLKVKMRDLKKRDGQ